MMAVSENSNKATMVEESERLPNVLLVIAFGRNGKIDLGCLPVLSISTFSFTSP